MKTCEKKNLTADFQLVFIIHPNQRVWCPQEEVTSTGYGRQARGKARVCVVWVASRTYLTNNSGGSILS